MLRVNKELSVPLTVEQVRALRECEEADLLEKLMKYDHSMRGWGLFDLVNRLRAAAEGRV